MKKIAQKGRNIWLLLIVLPGFVLPLEYSYWTFLGINITEYISDFIVVISWISRIIFIFYIRDILYERSPK